MMVSKKYFNVGLFNPGSLGSNHDEIIIAVLEGSIDMLAINETWLRPNEEKKAPAIPGYTLRSVPRPDNICNGRGGAHTAFLMIYVDKNIFSIEYI